MERASSPAEIRDLRARLVALLAELGRERLILATGDVHGCHEALQLTLEIVEPLSCRVVFLGDYINRGASSRAAVDLLLTRRAGKPRWVFLMGNHEAMFLRTVATGKMERVFPAMAWDEYQRLGGVPAEHLDFIESLDLFYESQSFIFVHGGVNKDPERPIAEHSADELLWAYEVTDAWKGKMLVRGHKIVPAPLVNANHISLDTGCFKGRFLTTGILDDVGGILLGWFQVSHDAQRIASALPASLGV